MKIELIYSEGCHTWKKALELIKQISEERKIQSELNVVKLETQEDAEKYHYFGSPQINVNGKDIDPMAEKITDYKLAGCRIYFYKGKMYEFPPKEMIEEAIEINKE